MFKLNKPFFVVAVLIALSGCATPAGYKSLMDTWVNHSESELISSWGAPQSVYNLDDGGKVLTFNHGRNIQLGGYATTTPVTTQHNGQMMGDVNGSYYGTSTTYVPSTTPVQNIQMNCTTRFTVRNGRIQSIAWEGNDCTALPPK